jgi:glycosyltransferase involved in cell wall biosynthesis
MSESLEISPTARPQSNTQGRRLRVVHLPVFSENAYQPLLMNCLVERGLQVIDGGGGGNFIRTALFRWKADLYHFHWLHPYLLRTKRLPSLLRATRFLMEVLVIRVSGARIVWTVHNLVNHEGRFPTIERLYSSLVARLADGIIVHSERAQDEVRRAYRLPGRTPVAVIPQGSYVERYPNQMPREECRSRLALPPDEFVFLFLGRIEPYKGVLDLIRCFRQLTGGSRLLLAGRISDPALLELLHKEMQGAANIKLDPGFVTDDTLQTYFNAADVFVFPVREILNSSSISLAMSFGLPCIAPAVGGIREMVGDSGGILYDPAEPRGLLNAMESAIERRNELPVVGRRSLLRARENTWSSVAVRTAAFYRSVMDKRGYSPH